MFPENNTGDLKLIENWEIQLGVLERNEMKQTNSYVNEKKIKINWKLSISKPARDFPIKIFPSLATMTVTVRQHWSSLQMHAGEIEMICQGQPQRETSLNGSVLRNHPQKIKTRRVNR